MNEPKIGKAKIIHPDFRRSHVHVCTQQCMGMRPIAPSPLLSRSCLCVVPAQSCKVLFIKEDFKP